MPMSKTIPLILALLANGCASPVHESALLSPLTLNSNPDVYHQQSVLVEGYVTLVASGHNLYQSKALNEEFAYNLHDGERFDPRPYIPYCLTIANPQIFEDHMSDFSGRTLVFRGRFLKNYLDGQTVDLGACPLPTAIVIDEADARRRYPDLFSGSKAQPR
jgi:hypothetical protein